jgi:hypothetical protein
MLAKTPDELHVALHTLWSQATGCPGYVKADWMKLGRILFQCAEAVMRLEPRQAGEGNPVTIEKLPCDWSELKRGPQQRRDRARTNAGYPRVLEVSVEPPSTTMVCPVM